METPKVSTFHEDDSGLRRAIADGDAYLLSTRIGNTDTPSVNFHMTSCGIWQRNAGSVSDNTFTKRYIKATSTSILPLIEYAARNYPKRPRRVCGCTKIPFAEALSAVPDGPMLEGATKSAKLTIAQAKEGLAATFGVKPDAIEINIRG